MWWVSPETISFIVIVFLNTLQPIMENRFTIVWWLRCVTSLASYNTIVNVKCPTNGLAEAFNKTVCNLLKKVISKFKRDSYERVGEAYGLV